MQYSQYSVNDFVMDEHFQKWVLKPDSDVNSFWETWISQHPENVGIIDESRDIILLINFNRHTFPREESLKIWININKKIEEHGIDKQHGPSTGMISHRLRFQYLRKIAAVFLGLMLIRAVWLLLHGPYRMT